MMSFFVQSSISFSGNEFTALQGLGDLWIDADCNFLALEQVRHLFDFLLNFIADRLRRL